MTVQVAINLMHSVGILFLGVGLIVHILGGQHR